MEYNYKKRTSADELRRRLSSIRNDSLHATRKSDFRAVARLTVEAARINRQLSEAVDLIAAVLDHKIEIEPVPGSY